MERVSVAVVVNDKRTPPIETEESLVDKNSTKDKFIENCRIFSRGNYQANNLVKGVVGFKEDHGDVVTLLPTNFYVDPPVPWFKDPITIDALKTAVASLIFLLFLLAIVRPIIRCLLHNFHQKP